MGIWIKRNNLENCDVVGKEEEILQSYLKFENEVDEDININKINNPFTYLKGKKYLEAINKDENCCFYGTI